MNWKAHYTAKVYVTVSEIVHDRDIVRRDYQYEVIYSLSSNSSSDDLEHS